jgi:Ca-activated chloride channel homolog
MILAVLAAAGSLLPPASPREQDRAVFRVATQAVRVDVFVGHGGRALPGLTAEDFEIYDDGKIQALDSVSVRTVPLSVVLALDTSTSVAGRTLDLLRESASAFAEHLSDGDRAALLTFSHHLSLRSTFTTDGSPLRGALRDVQADGATCWYDALFAALEILEPERDRPMVLLFTDGADTYSWLTEEQLLPLVLESNAIVYAVTRGEPPTVPDIRTTADRARWRQARAEHARRTRVLRKVTDESSGRLVETDSYDRLQTLFLEILDEMKTRYVLTYSPPEPVRDGWHELQVKVKRNGVDVRARRGYFYENRN